MYVFFDKVNLLGSSPGTVLYFQSEMLGYVEASFNVMVTSANVFLR